MSNDDSNDSVSKLVILVLGLATIGFFAYLIFKESMKYQVGGQQQTSLADDSYFQIDRRIHQLEMAKNVRTLQSVNKVEQMQPTQSTEYMQTPDAPPIPRKVVSMNSANKQSVVPNVHNLSKADQDKVRRLFFDMR